MGVYRVVENLVVVPRRWACKIKRHVLPSIVVNSACHDVIEFTQECCDVK